MILYQMHRFAADYYLGKWFPPTRHSSWTAGTYSFQYGDYGGVSRLNGESVYYFLAGKVGWFFREFFHVETYYRMIGLLLIAIILPMALYKMLPLFNTRIKIRKLQNQSN